MEHLSAGVVEALVLHARQANVLIGLLTSDLLEANARVPGHSPELDKRLEALERKSSHRYELIVAIVDDASDRDCEPGLIERHVTTLDRILEETADECEYAWDMIGDRLAVAQEFVVDENSSRAQRCNGCRGTECPRCPL
jgi:hypothetical protein